MRKALFAIVAVAMLVFAGAAMAGKVGHAKPFVYDPSDTGGGVAAWTKDGLSLQKNVATNVEVAAGAELKFVAGEKLEQLSFEVKGYCNPAPRFNVYTADTGAPPYFAFGCIHGNKELLADGWTRVTFTGDELGVAAGAFGSTMTGVDIVLDEQGQTLLRNISVNGVVIG